jgi:hypothetical protein
MECYSTIKQNEIRSFETTLWKLDIIMLREVCQAQKDKYYMFSLKCDIKKLNAIPLLGIYPKECDTGYSKGTCTPMFIAALFTIAKLWKQPRCPTTDEWIKKMLYLYTMEFY